MAEDKPAEQPTGAPVADGAVTGTGTEPPKKFPKGVVLGKDGKPSVLTVHLSPRFR
jgi:FAD-linked sulfhydryl oxidase